MRSRSFGAAGNPRAHVPFGVLTALLLAAPGLVFSQTCHWDHTAPAPDSVVHAMVAHDDGSGASLFVAGGFRNIGGEAMPHISRWDGQDWHDVGGGLNFDVYSLAVHDDGSGPALYAGGEFLSAGGMPASRIARWDGVQWSALGAGVDERVQALASHDPGDGARLYVGGRFVEAGGQPASHLASWDGSAWAEVGGGVNGMVFSLASVANGFNSETRMIDQRLWVGGLFSAVGPDGAEPVSENIAEWNGSRWFDLSTGANNIVRATVEFDDGTGLEPHIGGDFTMANVLAFRVAKYQFTQFIEPGEGVDDDVEALATFDDGDGVGLYAGGDFSEASGTPASGIARWDGETWAALGTGLAGGAVRTLAPFGTGTDRALYAGGWFLFAGGESAPYFARWLCPDDGVFDDGFEGTVSD